MKDENTSMTIPYGIESIPKQPFRAATRNPGGRVAGYRLSPVWYFRGNLKTPIKLFLLVQLLLHKIWNLFVIFYFEF
jgi:hypothetical protein